MKGLFEIPTALVLVAIAGCANTPLPSTPTQATFAPQPLYSASEEMHMTTCVGLTNNALSIAEYKLTGRSADDVRQEYSSKPLPQLTMPLIDKVYSDTFTNSWDYAISFSKECALHLAAIPEARVGLASYCVQHAMVASVARQYKDSNIGIEKVYERFAGYQTEWPKKVIENVYSQTGPRPEIVTNAWHSCMAPITGS